jgi:hypothetical protein
MSIGHLVCFSNNLLLSGTCSKLVEDSNVGVHELLCDHTQHDYREWA